MANMANISVDDTLVKMFTQETKMRAGKFKCLCMMYNSGLTAIVKDDRNTTEKLEDEPDIDDYENRLTYEKALFEDMKQRMIAVNTKVDEADPEPRGPRYFSWPFYYRTEAGNFKTCKEKIALVAWIDDDNLKPKEKMLGASGSRALPVKLSHNLMIEVHDAEEMNYDDLVEKASKF